MPPPPLQCRDLRRDIHGAVAWLVALVVAAAVPSLSWAQSPCTVVHVRGMAWTEAPSAPASSGARPGVKSTGVGSTGEGSADDAGSTSEAGSTSRVALAPGGSLALADTVRFGSSAARVLAFCPSAGRVVLQPQPDSTASLDQGAAPAVWVAVLRTAVTEPMGSQELSTRGALGPDTLRTLLDVRRHFGAASYLVLGPHAVPVAGPLRRALDEGGAFVLSAATERTPAGEKTSAGDAPPENPSSVALRVENGHVLVAPSELARIAAASADALSPAAHLHWEDGATQRFVAALHPMMPPPAQVQTEVQTLMRALLEQDATTVEVREEVYAFLGQAYGIAYRPHVRAWLAERFATFFP